jgi:hypothetical protein
MKEVVQTKCCTKCATDKPVTEFHRDKKAIFGVRARCKICECKVKRIHNARPEVKQQHQQRDKQRRLRNPVQSKEQSKKWRKNNPEKVKDRSYLRYGITTAQYLEMVAACNDQCHICGADRAARLARMKVFRKNLAILCVDHCHLTKTNRGLLCHPCNKGVGFFLDSPTLLGKAQDYLKPHCVDI